MNSISAARVVCLMNAQGKQSVYGIELLSSSKSLWGIEFSSTFHEKLLDTLHEGVYFVDTNRRITYWNHAAQNITGHSAAEAVGKRCFDDLLKHVDCAGKSLCRGSCLLTEVIQHGEPRETVMYLQHKEGHQVPISTKIVPMRDVTGTVIGAVETFRQIIPEKKSEIEPNVVEELAFRDLVTGLPNRRHMEFTFGQVSQEHAESKTQYGVLTIDIDNFKSINDKYGHESGDIALRAVADALVRSLRDTDFISRWGGDEFMVLLSGINALELGDLAERCRLLVSQTEIDSNGKTLKLTISIGGTLMQPGYSPKNAVSVADQLMYQSKKAGRNCTTLG